MQSLTRLARPLLASSLKCTPRTFTTLSPLRPSLTPLRRPSNVLSSFTPVPSSTATETADLVPRSAVSSHPALCGQQLCFGPRNTMQRASRYVQKRRLGFLVRMRSRTGRRIVLRRRLKKRTELGM